jgi:hypothetical protein
LETRLQIRSWDEKPYRELPDGQKFTRAAVELAGVEEHAGLAATLDALMYYAVDGTSTYVGVMQIVGRLDGRSGSFVLHSTGTFDGTTARSESHVVTGSGTEELAGISGTMTSASTHADYPFMPLSLSYDLG